MVHSTCSLWSHTKKSLCVTAGVYWPLWVTCSRALKYESEYLLLRTLPRRPGVHPGLRENDRAMKIGYPCINRSLDCKSNRTFRLANYSRDNLIRIVENNLDCMIQILEYNLKHDLMFFRIGSDLVPFASHPVCRVKWWKSFKTELRDIGDYIKKHRIRISMHPDQFVLINALDKDIHKRSVKELLYHARLLDAMELDPTAKMQIHVGGVYNDKPRSLERFVKRYQKLDRQIKDRLVIENDDRLYSFADCMSVYQKVGVPLVFDSFHHELNNNGESVDKALSLQSHTWRKIDGIPIVDYSSQQKGLRPGAHAHSIKTSLFREFLRESQPHDFDLMLEIKDKEQSALKAVAAARKDQRFIGGRWLKLSISV